MDVSTHLVSCENCEYFLANDYVKNDSSVCTAGNLLSDEPLSCVDFRSNFVPLYISTEFPDLYNKLLFQTLNISLVLDAIDTVLGGELGWKWLNQYQQYYGSTPCKMLCLVEARGEYSKYSKYELRTIIKSLFQIIPNTSVDTTK